MKHVCQNIRKLRINREWSQEYVAFNLQMSQSSYAKLESGQSKMSVDRLYQLAELFKLPMEEFLKNKQP